MPRVLEKPANLRKFQEISGIRARCRLMLREASLTCDEDTMDPNAIVMVRISTGPSLE